MIISITIGRLLNKLANICITCDIRCHSSCFIIPVIDKIITHKLRRKKQMKEIIFSDSTGESMEIAGVSYNDILIFPDNFFYGSIATEEDLDKHWDNSKQRTKKADFEECLKNGEDFRIWYSNFSPDELSGFYYACYLLSNYEGNIYVMNIREVGDFPTMTWGGQSSSEIKNLLHKRILLTEQEKDKIISEWNILRHENTNYREIDSSKEFLKSSYPDEISGLNYYERLALFANNINFQRTSFVLGNILQQESLDLDFTLSILVSLSKRTVPLIEFDVDNPETIPYEKTKCHLTKEGADICKRVDHMENEKDKENTIKERLELLQGLQKFYLLRKKSLKIISNSLHKSEAEFNLHKKLNFTFAQAEYIMDLPIKYLTNIYEKDTLKKLENIINKDKLQNN